MGKRVLVADDSATIQRAFSMVFGGLQDSISLVSARSFDEALSLARQGQPDLVIADIALGNRTGYELCAALKGDPGLRGIPVLILGSGQTPYDEGKGRQAGADGHLTKPFESQALIDRVHEAMARPVAQAAPRSDAPPPVASARPVGARPVIAAVELDDEYGEFTIERSSSGSGARAPSASPVLASASPPMPAPVAAPVPRPAPAAPVPSSSPFAPAHSSAPPSPAAGSGVALRPSLIPGARPTPVVRPPVTLHPGSGVASASVAAPSGAAQRPAPSLPKRAEPPADPAGSAPAPTAAAGMGRTIMGLPAVAIPGSPLAPREARPAAPVVLPAVAPTAPTVVPAPIPALTPFAPSRPSVSPAPFPLAPVSSAESAAVVSARIDQKVAAIASRGPEYEAIAKLSREVIEQVVWEVVPELAELIIREHVERLANARK